MRYVQARDALISHLHNSWTDDFPDVPVVYDNAEVVDLDTVGDSFLRVSLTFEHAEQATLGATPIQKISGNLYIYIYSKVGAGTRSGLTYLDYLSSLFKFQNLSGVQVGTPSPIHKEARDGWHFQLVGVPFFFHIN